MQTKSTKGRVSLESSTANKNFSGLLLKPGAIKFMINGIKISKITNKINRNDSNNENIVERNSSDFFFPNLVLIPDTTGIKAEFTDPSAKSLLNKFGNLNETKKASETSPAPKNLAIKRSRI